VHEHGVAGPGGISVERTWASTQWGLLRSAAVDIAVDGLVGSCKAGCTFGTFGGVLPGTSQPVRNFVNFVRDFRLSIIAQPDHFTRGFRKLIASFSRHKEQ
jgi:hypothetical protein